MTEMRAAYRLDLVGNLFRNARRVSAEMERMSGRSEDALARMQRRTAAVENGIGALSRRATGLAAGFVGVGEVRRLIRAEEVIRQIGVNAGWSDERIDALARRNGALAAEWSVLASDIVEGQDRIQAMTGNLDFGEAVAEQIAIARRATGAGGSDVGGMIGMLHNIAGVRDVSGIGQALDIWAAQGNVGQFELASFAAVGSEAGTAYQPLHRQGEDFARELGAIMNMLAGATGGNAPKAVTLLENLIPKLLSADIESRLQGAGVRFRDAAGEYRAGTDILMDTTKALYAKAGQAGMTPQQALEKLFGKDLEIGKAFAPFIEDFRDGAFDQLETYLAVETGGILDRNALRMKETAAAALTGALGDIRQVTGEMLSGPIREMAAALNALDAGTVARWGEIAKHLGIAFAAWKGVQIGAGVVGAISDLRNLRRGRVGGAITGGLTAASGVAGALGDLKPQPVIVTNWPAGFSMGTGAKGSVARGTATGAAGGVLAQVAPPLAVAAGTLYMGKDILETAREAEEHEESFTAARERRLGIPEGLETPLGRLPNLPDPVGLLGEALMPLLGRLRTAGTGKPPAPEKAAPVIRSRLAEFGAGASAFRPVLPSPGAMTAPPASAAGAGLVERPPSLADISAGLTAFFPARPEAQDTAPSDPALLDAVRDVTDEVRSVGERIGDVERALKTRPLQHATPGSTGRLSVHP